MKSVTNKLGEKTGVRAATVLLILLFMVFTVSAIAVGAPGITYGDINDDGTIDVRDVVLVMRYVLEVEDLTDDQVAAADVNGDGVVDVRDATKIMQYALGLIDEFPDTLRIESVEEIEIKVGYGTAYEDIEFPETVKATLHDESEKEIDVEWDDESDPEYDPKSTGKYTFEGELVNLPDRVTNPDDVKAVAVANVRHRYIPPYREPAPEEYTVTFEEERGLEDVTIKVYYDEDLEEDDKVSGELTTDSDGKATKKLVDGEYWFTASYEDYEDFEGNFEVAGSAKTVDFIIGPSDYEFEVSPADSVYGEYLYDEHWENNSADYYVYATEENTSAGYVYAEADVTFKYVFEGNEGYDGVKFKFELKDENETGKEVIFEAEDDNDDVYTFTNEGTWGPPGGFDVTKDYDKTTEWLLKFSDEDETYEIKMSLVDASDDEVKEDVYGNAVEKTVRIMVGSDPPGEGNPDVVQSTPIIRDGF